MKLKKFCHVYSFQIVAEHFARINSMKLLFNAYLNSFLDSIIRLIKQQASFFIHTFSLPHNDKLLNFILFLLIVLLSKILIWYKRSIKF